MEKVYVIYLCRDCTLLNKKIKQLTEDLNGFFTKIIVYLIDEKIICNNSEFQVRTVKFNTMDKIWNSIFSDIDFLYKEADYFLLVNEETRIVLSDEIVPLNKNKYFQLSNTTPESGCFLIRRNSNVKAFGSRDVFIRPVNNERIFVVPFLSMKNDQPQFTQRILQLDEKFYRRMLNFENKNKTDINYTKNGLACTLFMLKKYEEASFLFLELKDIAKDQFKFHVYLRYAECLHSILLVDGEKIVNKINTLFKIPDTSKFSFLDFFKNLNPRIKIQATWISLGKKLQEKHEEIISLYTECWKLRPTRAEPIYKRGILRRYFGDTTGAINDFLLCQRIKPTTSETFSFDIRCYEILPEIEICATYFMKEEKMEECKGMVSEFLNKYDIEKFDEPVRERIGVLVKLYDSA